MIFEPFPKLARLSREMVITEKIDGTNAQVCIRELPDDEVMPTDTPIVAVRGNLLIYAGSRSRWLTPNSEANKAADNFGFAAWVRDNADELAQLGPGRHFGEWWGSGIQRGYGLPKGEKRFSLFNVSRWHAVGAEPFVNPSPNPRTQGTTSQQAPACCSVVPVLHRGTFNTLDIVASVSLLRVLGSTAAPGFMDPEGIVVFHTASGMSFKKTLEKDETPKSFVRGAA